MTCEGQERRGSRGCGCAAAREQEALGRAHHVLPVRPPPVGAQASGTPAEDSVGGSDRRRHGVRGLGQRLERRVAAQAARERVRSGREIEAAQHLDRLLLRPQRPHAVAAGDEPALEQPAIARQQDAALTRRAGRELGVVGAAAVFAVEPEHAQEPRQGAEMRVEQESEAAQRLGPHLRDRGDVEALEDGVDADTVAGGDLVIEPHGCAVDENEVHFRVGDAEVLDQREDGARSAADLDRPGPHGGR